METGAREVDISEAIQVQQRGTISALGCMKCP
jgi:hypothetical protein